MTQSTQLFQKDKPLFEWWQAVALNENFQRVLIHARSTLLENQGLNPDKIDGVRLLSETLVQLCDTQEIRSPSVTTGLNHDLSVPRTIKK